MGNQNRSAATLRGYSTILIKYNKILKDTDRDREKEKLCKAHEKAYWELILACQGPIAFKIVRKCTTDDLPTGNAYLAWNKLKVRFDPRTSNEKLQLKENSPTRD